MPYCYIILDIFKISQPLALLLLTLLFEGVEKYKIQAEPNLSARKLSEIDVIPSSQPSSPALPP